MHLKQQIHYISVLHISKKEKMYADYFSTLLPHFICILTAYYDTYTRTYCTDVDVWTGWCGSVGSDKLCGDSGAASSGLGAHRRQNISEEVRVLVAVVFFSSTTPLPSACIKTGGKGQSWVIGVNTKQILMLKGSVK